MIRGIATIILISLMLGTLGACATYQTFEEGRKLVESGQLEEGLPMVRQAAEEKP